MNFCLQFRIDEDHKHSRCRRKNHLTRFFWKVVNIRLTFKMGFLLMTSFYIVKKFVLFDYVRGNIKYFLSVFFRCELNVLGFQNFLDFAL